MKPPRKSEMRMGDDPDRRGARPARSGCNYQRVRGQLELSIHFTDSEDEIYAGDRRRYSAARDRL
jgi:hypothetical protein